MLEHCIDRSTIPYLKSNIEPKYTYRIHSQTHRLMLAAKLVSNVEMAHYVWPMHWVCSCMPCRVTLDRVYGNRPISQIPQCICSISHNAPSWAEICTFLLWMVHCGIWCRYIAGFSWEKLSWSWISECLTCNYRLQTVLSTIRICRNVHGVCKCQCIHIADCWLSRTD